MPRLVLVSGSTGSGKSTIANAIASDLRCAVGSFDWLMSALRLVAREVPRAEWIALAGRYGAAFGVIECVCSNAELQRSRVEGRRRDIPGWHELTTSDVERSRSRYVPLDEPKLVIDSAFPLEKNLAEVRDYLGGMTVGERRSQRT